jgi:hypothetical protein
MSTKWRVRKYPAGWDTEEFQRRVIDLAREIPKNLNDKDELKNIARTLKEIAYNKPIKLPTAVAYTHEVVGMGELDI